MMEDGTKKGEVKKISEVMPETPQETEETPTVFEQQTPKSLMLLTQELVELRDIEDPLEQEKRVAELIITEMDFQNKIDKYVMFLDHLEAEAVISDNWAKQFKEQAQSLRNLRESLRGNIRLAMAQLNQKKILGEVMKFQLQNTQFNLETIDVDELPDDCIKDLLDVGLVRLKVEFDNKKIREWFKEQYGPSKDWLEPKKLVWKQLEVATGTQQDTLYTRPLAVSDKT